MRTGLYQKIICYCISAILCIFYAGVLCLSVCTDTEKEYRMYYIDKTLQRCGFGIGEGGFELAVFERGEGVRIQIVEVVGPLGHCIDIAWWISSCWNTASVRS